MQKVVPALRITNYERSKAFYEDKLAFTIDWEHRFEPGFPVFMQVSRDDMAFYLTEHSGDCQVGGLIHLVVSDVDAWFGELQAKGVTGIKAPDEGIEGIRSMTLVDPDGNQIRVMTYLETSS